MGNGNPRPEQTRRGAVSGTGTRQHTPSLLWDAAVAVNLRAHMQFAPVRCAITQDVADDLFEDQLDVVARACGLRQFFGVEGPAQCFEGLSEACQRPEKSESNRVRVYGDSRG